MDDWLGMTAAELGRGIGGGRIDPVALTEALSGRHRRASAPRPHLRPA